MTCLFSFQSETNQFPNLGAMLTGEVRVSTAAEALEKSA